MINRVIFHTSITVVHLSAVKSEGGCAFSAVD